MTNVIQSLIKERDGLLAELEQIQSQYGQRIIEINKAICKLGDGKPLPEIEAQYKYDDESTTYITGNEDGI